jgi:hypothetical protein
MNVFASQNELPIDKVAKLVLEHGVRGLRVPKRPGPKGRFSDADVRNIRELHAQGVHIESLAARYGCSKAHISQIANRLSYREVEDATSSETKTVVSDTNSSGMVSWESRTLTKEELEKFCAGCNYLKTECQCAS